MRRAWLGRQARLDVAQALAPSQLREGHRAELLGTGHVANAGIALVSLDDSPEGLPRHELHDLREQRLARIHLPLREYLPGK